MAYFGQLEVNGSSYLVGSSLYGVCNTNPSLTSKVISTGILGRDFDQLVQGITVNIQFVRGNTQESITLQVGSTGILPVMGNAKCNQNAVLAFTYDTIDNVGYWILNAGEKTATTVMQHYDSTSMEPISGQGVAEAIAPLTGSSTAAAYGVDTEIDEYPSHDRVPTSAAVAGYVTDSFGRVNALLYKGTVGTGGDVSDVPSYDYKTGWLYRVITEGTYAGQYCEAGDLILCTSDAGAWQINVDPSHWTIIQKNISRPVSGPETATQNHVAVFGSSANTIVDSGYTIEASVPQNAVFTDTHYEDVGYISAITNLQEGTELTLASVNQGTLRIKQGLDLTKTQVSLGIQEAT